MINSFQALQDFNQTGDTLVILQHQLVLLAIAAQIPPKSSPCWQDIKGYPVTFCLISNYGSPSLPAPKVISRSDRRLVISVVCRIH